MKGNHCKYILFVKEGKKMNKKFKTFILYFSFGCGTTAINWGIYILLVEGIGAGMTVSNFFGWIFANTFSFVTNKVYVFGSKSWHADVVLREGTTFFGSRAMSGIVDVFGPSFLFSIGINKPFLGVEGFPAKMLSGCIVICMNYVFSKTLVFRENRNIKSK